jgi:DNA gyrase inhibitor GyrI
VQSEPERFIAYVRVTNPFIKARMAEAQQALGGWLQARGVTPSRFLGLSHDDPAHTAPQLCRYDVACVLPGALRGSGGVSVRRLAPGRFATVQVRGGVADLERAWAELFDTWLPSSGFEPEDGPGEERFEGAVDFTAGSVELALPVRRTVG